MSRDLWLTRRAAVQTTKIPQSLTVPAGEYDCGETQASLYFNGSYDSFSVDNVTLPRNVITIEAWVNCLGLTTNIDYPIFCVYEAASSPYNPIYALVIRNNKLVFRYTKAASVGTITSLSNILIGNWSHVAVVWDGTNVKLYINGVLDSTTALAASVDAGTDNYTVGYYRYGGNLVFLGYINELRVWSVARTFDQLLGAMFAPRIVTLEPDLEIYFKCRSLPSFSQIHEEVTDMDVSVITPGSAALTTEVYYPQRYGASFICAEWAFALTYKFSLVFPIVPPEETTGQLCVSWTDPNGNFQRRALYELDGVDILPPLDIYMGEALGEDATLELWNIDGNSTAVIPEDLIIYVSKTSDPTDSYDHTAVAAATLTTDTTLAEPFPLTPFPLEFNAQQTY